MKKFSVCFDRAMSEQIEVEVEASSEAEAYSIARDKLEGLIVEGRDEWEQTDYTGDHQVVFCAEVL